MRYGLRNDAVFARSGDSSGRDGNAGSPIDIAHLTRQTMDDPDLQREVLQIFVEQVAIARHEVPAAVGDDRKRLAHKLKGAARAVGAFALADCAERLIEHPDDEAALANLVQLVDEASACAAAMAE